MPGRRACTQIIRLSASNHTLRLCRRPTRASMMAIINHGHHLPITPVVRAGRPSAYVDRAQLRLPQRHEAAFVARRADARLRPLQPADADPGGGITKAGSHLAAARTLFRQTEPVLPDRPGTPQRPAASALPTSSGDGRHHRRSPSRTRTRTRTRTRARTHAGAHASMATPKRPVEMKVRSQERSEPPMKRSETVQHPAAEARQRKAPRRSQRMP